MDNIIEIKNLTKKYKEATAVDGISFHVRRGEIFGILGPNGAGKTTTLEMVEGLKPLTSGQAILDGLDVSAQTHEVKARIGVQLQASSFFENLSLKELIETFASLYNRQVNALELLREVQLEEKAQAEVKELSGGQKQRFSIAVALVNDPKVLFLDEPTTGLDPQARRNLWDLISAINKKGKTIVITTHYMDEAEILCDRIAIMDHAKIVALDDTQTLLKLPGLSSSIHFRPDNERTSIAQLQALAAVSEVQKTDQTFRLTTQNPETTLAGLFAHSHDAGFRLLDLQVKQPTLEDVFLQLTGHALRD